MERTKVIETAETERLSAEECIREAYINVKNAWTLLYSAAEKVDDEASIDGYSKGFSVGKLYTYADLQRLVKENIEDFFDE